MSTFVELLQKRIESDPDLTVAGLASKAGLDKSAIRQMISRGRNPKLETMQKICQALGVSLDSFMRGEDQDGITREILHLLDELSDAERRFLLASAKGLLSQRD